MMKLQDRLNKLAGRFNRGDDGATAIEYALIAAATGLALAATLPFVQTGLTGTYARILGYFTAVGV